MREGSNLLERRLASILSADVVDYSRLMDENEQSAIAAIRELKETYLEPNGQNSFQSIKAHLPDRKVATSAFVLRASALIQ